MRLKIGRKTRRIAIYTLLILGGVVGSYFYFTRPTRIALIAEQALEEMSGADVQVREARFSLVLVAQTVMEMMVVLVVDLRLSI